MDPEPQLFFAPFRLDCGSEQLWRGEERLPLRPKAFALLRYLAEHPQRLLTQAELLQAVWGRIYASGGLLRTYIRELRGLLGDDAEKPRFIETATRRGYRFIAPVSTAPLRATLSTRSPSQAAFRFVGREAELAVLERALEAALGGRRQVVFVTGEPGIGKTALVEAFLAQIADAQGLWIGRGQCLEQYGAGEAYLPVLEALGSLVAGAEGAAFLSLLRRQAPTWLLQMPALIDEAEQEALQRRVYGATQERMARELAEALDALTAERRLLVWLEDLHWSDPSTLDLLGMLATRRAPARLLVLGTYRPAEAIASAHPVRALARGLLLHAQAAELRLSGLTRPEVSQYLSARFALTKRGSLEPWARLLHERSDGNPLFLVALVEDLVVRGVIGEAADAWPLPERLEAAGSGLPQGLRELLEGQFERLSAEERRIAETASVAGMEFSAALLATAMDTGVAQVETCCEALVRRQFLLGTGEGHSGPERRRGERYGFFHALYQNAVYQRVPMSRRRRLHQCIGECMERAAGARATNIAHELAAHFEQGQDYGRAVQYQGQAAQNALRRAANREAIYHLSRGLELLKALPDTPERSEQELMLQVTLGAPLLMTRGYAAPEVKAAYDRAHALCAQVGGSPQLCVALAGLCRFYIVRAEFQKAQELAGDMLRHARGVSDSISLLMAYMLLSSNALFQGEFALARTHAEQGITLNYPRQNDASIFLYGDEPDVACLYWAAVALWFLGYPDQALEQGYRALRMAHEVSQPYTVSSVLFWTAFLHQSRREAQGTRQQAEALLALTQEQGIPQLSALGTIWHGWALAEQGHGEVGIAQIRQGIADMGAMGQELGRPQFLALLAEAYGKGGQVEEGLMVLREALEITHTTGECMHQAELYRLKGTLTLRSKALRPRHPAPASNAAVEAEACFYKAIEIARRQSAKSLELRAVVSLCRLRQAQGSTEEARKQLAEVYGWFTEGFDTNDLQDVRALLASLP